MVLDSLIRLGFTEKEALVYWTLIRHGSTAVSSLAERASLKRVTVYSILESLSQRGLVQHEDAEHGRRYFAQDPENLLYGIEQERAAVQTKMELAKSCIQELQQPYERTHFTLRRFMHIQGAERLGQILSEELSPTKKLQILEAHESSPAKSFLYQWLARQPKTFSRSLHVQGECSTTEKAVLLLQDDLLFFIKQSPETNNKIEGMLIRDASYTRFVKEGLIKPFLESQKVPQPIQPALL